MPGRLVNGASGSRGEGKADARDAYVTAHQARDAPRPASIHPGDEVTDRTATPEPTDQPIKETGSGRQAGRLRTSMGVKSQPTRRGHLQLMPILSP